MTTDRDRGLLQIAGSAVQLVGRTIVEVKATSIGGMGYHGGVELHLDNGWSIEISGSDVPDVTMVMRGLNWRPPEDFVAPATVAADADPASQETGSRAERLVRGEHAYGCALGQHHTGSCGGPRVVRRG